MEQQNAMRMMEDQLKRFGDQISVLAASQEDLNFRAIRIQSAAKLNKVIKDITFGDDIGILRKRVRTFCGDISVLPGILDSLERGACYQPGLLNLARSLMSTANNAAQLLNNFTDSIRQLHQHINDADLKIQAWYMVSDLENICQKISAISATISSRVIVKLTTPPADEPSSPPNKT